MLRLTRAQVREIDRRSIEEYGIPGIVLMENASRAAATVAAEMLGGRSMPRIVIVCGPGNNGGDGLAVARHLSILLAAQIELILTIDPAQYRGDAATNWHIVQRMGLPVLDDLPDGKPDLIIDAIFGTGLTRPPEKLAALMIEWMNAAGVPILSIDIPSGLDCDSGDPIGRCVRATKTITFVAEKAGFANPAARAYTGSVAIGDIGCPRGLIEDVAAAGI